MLAQRSPQWGAPSRLVGGSRSARVSETNTLHMFSGGYLVIQTMLTTQKRPRERVVFTIIFGGVTDMFPNLLKLR
jgi:hypothetical protein